LRTAWTRSREVSGIVFPSKELDSISGMILSGYRHLSTVQMSDKHHLESSP
jgi:hypothetical protein